MEKVASSTCPKCLQSHMNVYFSDGSESKVGAWCEYCDFKGYFLGDQLVAIIA